MQRFANTSTREGYRLRNSTLFCSLTFIWITPELPVRWCETIHGWPFTYITLEHRT